MPIFDKISRHHFLTRAVLFSEIKLYSVALYDACLAFIPLETDEADNVLTHVHKIVDTLKKHDQVNVSYDSSYEKLITFIFCI